MTIAPEVRGSTNSVSENGQPLAQSCITVGHELAHRARSLNDGAMSQSKDYVLGTTTDEITRLGLQHQVWRPHMLGAWRRAGMTRKSRVIDFGAGPGYASLDAADIVGPGGQVIAIERSPHFLSFAQVQIDRRGIDWLRLVDADLMDGDLNLNNFDIAWCRWVASFVSTPAKLAAHVAAALRIGGRAVVHEYQSYATWRVIPRNPRIEEFVSAVMASWRASGGEPDVMPILLPLLLDAGFKLVELRPLIFAAQPSSFTWQWPAAFVAVNSQRLIDLGRVTQEWADALCLDFASLSANPDAVMITPMVMEAIVEKVR
jgi:protein-L-isoaspartate O-methyltransferase